MQVSSRSSFPFVDGVKVVANCILKVVDEVWPFAQDNAAEIDVHWQSMRQSNPSYFNGIVHLVRDVRLSDGVLHASLLRTEFKSYLYWRMQGFPEAGVLDGFGSALIRSSDGHVMLARQTPGNINHGFACLPSGFIDERDVLPDRTIDITLSVAREIAEELGEIGSLLEREDGFVIIRSGTQLCFSVPFYLPIATAEFVRLVDQHNATSPDPELESIVPVASLADIESVPMLRYVQVLLKALFAAR